MSGLEKFFNPEFPTGWRYPRELEGPSGSPLTNLAIMVLASNLVGNDVVESVGLLIAANARFNVWYGEDTGGRRTPLELAEMRAANSEIHRGVYVAWKDLETLAEDEDQNQWNSAYMAFLHEIRTATMKYCQTMHETLADFGNL